MPSSDTTTFIWLLIAATVCTACTTHRQHSPMVQVNTPRRNVVALAAAWRPISAVLNTTFTTHPSRDVIVVGAFSNVQTCSAAGATIIVGQGDQNTTVDCIANKVSSSCRYTCQATDVATNEVIQRVTTAAQNAVRWAQSMLLVREPSPPEVTIIPALPTDGGNCDSINRVAQTVVADIVVFVTVRPLSVFRQLAPFSPPQATSDVCVVSSETGRPVQSVINIDPYAVVNMTNAGLDNLARHMLVHALGVSSGAVPFYRNQVTGMEYDAPPFVVARNGVVINDPKVFTTNVNGSSREALSSFVNMSYIDSVTRLGMVTPRLLAYTRAFLGCSSLAYVELENFSPLDTHFDMHLEARLFPQELMSAEPGASLVTNATLSLLLDTGYYRIAPSFVPDTGNWGLGRGCGWAGTRCGAVWGDYGCTARSENLPGYDATFYGLCNIVNYSGALPSGYQQMSIASLGGGDQFADFCPFVDRRSATSVSCNINSGFARSQTYTVDGSTSGATTRAVLNSLIGAQLASSATRASCLPFACTDLGAMVQVGEGFYLCPSGQNVSFSFPRLSRSTYVNYEFYQNLTCPNTTTLCSPATKRFNSDLWGVSAQPWPSITSVSPLDVDIGGGTLITVVGTWPSTITCGGIRLGGEVMMASTPATNNTLIVNSTDILDSEDRFGGINADGTGAATVQLLCSIPGYSCSIPGTGNAMCGVAFAPETVVISMRAEDSSGSSSENVFFASAGGQVAAFSIGFVILVIITVIMYKVHVMANRHDQSSRKPAPMEQSFPPDENATHEEDIELYTITAAPSVGLYSPQQTKTAPPIPLEGL